MKLIHTADWHLGQYLYGQSRIEEQKHALDLLYKAILDQKAELLIVAGDIFDTGNPSEEVRRIYHKFLARLAKSPLKWVVIVGGNHDSPRMLEATRDLTEILSIFIVALPSPEDNPAKDLIELREEDGTLRAVVAAVPFLPERLIRNSRAGESDEDKALALSNGILRHYQKLADLCEAYSERVPLIATGHLYATGAQARDGQDNIYVGNIRNIAAEQLPKCFNYIALGHIHRPQALPGCPHICYSGSLIPLDFQESIDIKSIHCVQFDSSHTPQIECLPFPTLRRLKRLLGNPDELIQQITEFALRHASDELRPWLEVEMTEAADDESQRQRLRDLAKSHDMTLLRIFKSRSSSLANRQAQGQNQPLELLREFKPEELFERRLESSDLDASAKTRMRGLFREVMEDLDSTPEIAAV